MCPNDNSACTKPLLPRRWDSLFDSEAGSDVIFLVGPEQWRFPGNRAVLADANSVFRAMLHGPMASQDTTIPIEDVDGRAFDNLLRYLYKEAVHLQSVSTALHTLYAAFKYQCGGLVKICVHYLDSKLDSSSVLEIYRHLRVYCDSTLSSQRTIQDNHSSSQQPSLSTSSPTTEYPFYRDHIATVTDEGSHFLPSNSEAITDALFYCHALEHNCLQYIDVHTKEVLEQEELEDLDPEGVRLIALRETLTVTLESVLFDALVRWCNCECKRRRLELSAENKRAVLGEDTLYAVRYLLMSSEEFLAGPVQSGLLNPSEVSEFLGYILHHPVPDNPRPANVICRMRTPRSGPQGQPMPLSQRSSLETHNTALSRADSLQSGNSRLWGGKKDGKKDAKKRKKEKKRRDDADEESVCCCFFEYFLSALACLFD